MFREAVSAELDVPGEARWPPLDTVVEVVSSQEAEPANGVAGWRDAGPEQQAAVACPLASSIAGCCCWRPLHVGSRVALCGESHVSCGVNQMHEFLLGFFGVLRQMRCYM